MNIDSYANVIPGELKRAIHALDHDIRLAIISALVENGKMSFSQLKKTLDINQSTLTHHLKILMKGSMITNFYKKEAAIGDYSYYAVTDFCKLVLGSLFQTLMQLPSHPSDIVPISEAFLEKVIKRT